MYTLIAFGMVLLLALNARREQKGDSDDSDANIKETRQDIRLMVWLLAAAVVMLGVIADRIH